MTRRRPRPAAVLMEVLVSIAIFVATAAFALVALRSVLGALDRQQRTALAVDLARAKMAELEAGLVTVEQLRDDDGLLTSVGSLEPPGGFDDAVDVTWPWEIEVDTARTEFEGLSLVELTVRESTDLLAAEDRPVQYTLRQLVAFGTRPRQSPPADDLLDGLPADAPDASPAAPEEAAP